MPKTTMRIGIGGSANKKIGVTKRATEADCSPPRYADHRARTPKNSRNTVAGTTRLKLMAVPTGEERLIRICNEAKAKLVNAVSAVGMIIWSSVSPREWLLSLYSSDIRDAQTKAHALQMAVTITRGAIPSISKSP